MKVKWEFKFELTYLDVQVDFAPDFGIGGLIEIVGEHANALG